VRISPVIALLLISVAGGCGSSMSYHPGDTPHVCRAPADGQYNLYARGEKYPAYAYMLRGGDPIGFARDTHGRLIGLADGDRFALSERDYRWVYVSRQSTEGWAANQPLLRDAYRFLFEDILTPAFVVIYVLHGIPGVRS
jgi:hypothetical protein